MKYFQTSEFACSHTGKNDMEKGFLERLDILRERCGFPFHITSGFRDATHPEEITKIAPGTHAKGIAVDIRVSGGSQRRKIVEEAVKMGFAGIGVAKTFVHVDDRQILDPNTPRVMWVY